MRFTNITPFNLSSKGSKSIVICRVINSIKYHELASIVNSQILKYNFYEQKLRIISPFFCLTAGQTTQALSYDLFKKCVQALRCHAPSLRVIGAYILILHKEPCGTTMLGVFRYLQFRFLCSYIIIFNANQWTNSLRYYKSKQIDKVDTSYIK